MTTVDESRQLIDNAPRITVNLDLRRLCDERQLNRVDVDWEVFPQTVTLELLCMDNIRDVFRSYIGAFSRNNMKFCLQVFLPRTVLVTENEVVERFQSMITEIMCRREFNQELLRRVSAVNLITYYRGFACVSLHTSRFDDIRVFRKSIQKCVDAICETITVMAEYNAELDAVLEN